MRDGCGISAKPAIQDAKPVPDWPSCANDVCIKDAESVQHWSSGMRAPFETHCSPTPASRARALRENLSKCGSVIGRSKKKHTRVECDRQHMRLYMYPLRCENIPFSRCRGRVFYVRPETAAEVAHWRAVCRSIMRTRKTSASKAFSRSLMSTRRS